MSPSEPEGSYHADSHQLEGGAITSEINTVEEDDEGASHTTTPTTCSSDENDFPNDDDATDHDGSGEAVNQAVQQFMSQFDAERMKLTQQEYDWALAIKRAIEGTPDLDAMTDFMCCQLGIVGEGNVEWALNKAYQLQEYKKEHQILDTVEDALRQIPDLVKDRCLLSVDYNLEEGGYIVAYDGPKFDMTVFKSKERLCGLFQRFYYIPLLACPDFAAVRAGITSLYDCDGFKIGVNMFSVQQFRKSVFALATHPAIYGKTKFYNTPKYFDLIISTTLSALPRKVSEGFKVGCSFPLGTLAKAFNIPNSDVAVGRLCVKLEELIRRRYENEKHFSLDSATLDTTKT